MPQSEWPRCGMRGTVPDPDGRRYPDLTVEIVEVFGDPNDGFPPTIVVEVDDSDRNYGGRRFDAYSYHRDFRPAAALGGDPDAPTAD